MKGTRPFTGDTFNGAVVIGFSTQEDGSARVFVMEVADGDVPIDDTHMWGIDGTPEEMQGIYETLLSMRDIEEDYIEAMGFEYI